MLIRTKTVIQECGWDVMSAVQVNNIHPTISSQVASCYATNDIYLCIFAICEFNSIR